MNSPQSQRMLPHRNERKRIVLAVVLAVFVTTLIAFENCGQNSVGTPVAVGPIATPTPAASTPAVAGSPPVTSTIPPLNVNASQANVMPVTVGQGYFNEPAVSVKICAPGTTNCTVVSNILLDTGSYGLRVFASTLTGLNLQQVVDANNHHLAVCQTFADGSSDWGSIVKADLVLGGETAKGVSIQAIDSNFGKLPSDCGKPDQSPQAAGFNGILGVGLMAQDCGSSCVTTSNNRLYFDCASGAKSCETSVAVALQYQVTNPVSLFATDNNGVILQLDSVPALGAVSSKGYLIFGIGTQTNSKPPQGVVTFQADSNAYFQTTFMGKNYPLSFIDSGSNTLAFPLPSSGVTACSSSGIAPSFYCQNPAQNYTATMIGTNGTPSRSITFQLGNAESFLAATNPNNVFMNIGSTMDGSFDWGLPFFLGRTVYVGLEGTTSSLGTGPYWAF